MAAQDIIDQWSPVFADIAPKYGLDPDLLTAIALQENVSPKHNNPLGLSDDSGVHSYSSDDEARAAIERQARLLTNPNGPYSAFVKSGSIQDLARVYSPVGARNDPNQTNATEGSGIIAQLSKLKGGAYNDAAPISAPTTTSIASAANTAPSYLGADTTGTPTPSVSPSQWGSPLLDQIRQLQAAQALSGSRRPGLIGQQGGSNQVVSALQNAIKTAQIIQKLRGGSGGLGGLGGLGGSALNQPGVSYDPVAAMGAEEGIAV